MLGRLESESGAIWCLYVGVKTTTFNKKNVSRKIMDAGKIRFTDVFSKNLNKCIDYFTNILLNESNYPKYQNYA